MQDVAGALLGNVSIVSDLNQSRTRPERRIRSASLDESTMFLYQLWCLEVCKASNCASYQTPAVVLVWNMSSREFVAEATTFSLFADHAVD